MEYSKFTWSDAWKAFGTPLSPQDLYVKWVGPAEWLSDLDTYEYGMFWLFVAEAEKGE